MFISSAAGAGLLSLLPRNADVMMSPESRACGQQCEPAEPLAASPCAPAAVSGAVPPQYLF